MENIVITGSREVITTIGADSRAVKTTYPQHYLFCLKLITKYTLKVGEEVGE